MSDGHSGQVAILYPGDYETRRNASPENNYSICIMFGTFPIPVRFAVFTYHRKGDPHVS